MRHQLEVLLELKRILSQLVNDNQPPSREDLKVIDKKVKEIVNASAEFAKDSPEPAVEELWTDIYA